MQVREENKKINDLVISIKFKHIFGFVQIKKIDIHSF